MASKRRVSNTSCGTRGHGRILKRYHLISSIYLLIFDVDHFSKVFIAFIPISLLFFYGLFFFFGLEVCGTLIP